MRDRHMPLPVGKLPARFERLALQTHRKWKVPREQARYLYWHMSELLEVSEILQWLLKKDPQDRPFLFYGAMHDLLYHMLHATRVLLGQQKELASAKALWDKLGAFQRDPFVGIRKFLLPRIRKARRMRIARKR